MTGDVTSAEEARPEPEPDDTGRFRPARRGSRRLSFRLDVWTAVLSFAIVLVVLCWIVLPGLFASGSPITAVPHDRLLEPSWAHLFGTDSLGRDLFTRVVHGARTSLSAAGLAVAIGLVIGSVTGIVCGFFGGRLDAVVMRVVDVLLAIPDLLLAMALVAALGFGTVQVGVAVGVSSIASFARLSRSEARRVSASTYVEAARVGGVRPSGVLWRHVLRGSLGPVLALGALEIGSAILAVAALSFLGYGTPPPTPEWGTLISDGRNYISSAWWLTVLPGLVIMLLVLSVNRLSRLLDRQIGVRR